MRKTRKDVQAAVERFNRIHGDRINGKLIAGFENEGMVIEIESGKELPGGFVKKERRLARNLSTSEACAMIELLDEYQSVFTFNAQV
jgi:hypothetical protein